MPAQTSANVPPQVNDITGQRFNRLIALRFIGVFNESSKWEFRCDCGRTVQILARSVKNGHTQSCGCFRREKITTHGASKDGPLYKIWQGMKRRCEQPNAINFYLYGGRGIRILWKNYEAFAADMEQSWKSGLTIERIDNNGHYSKENCKWATRKEQSRNRRVNHLLTFNGQTLCIFEWAERLGFKRSILFERLKRGWSVDKTLTTPAK